MYDRQCSKQSRRCQAVICQRKPSAAEYGDAAGSYTAAERRRAAMCTAAPGPFQLAGPDARQVPQSAVQGSLGIDSPPMQPLTAVGRAAEQRIDTRHGSDVQAAQPAAAAAPFMTQPLQREARVDAAMLASACAWPAAAADRAVLEPETDTEDELCAPPAKRRRRPMQAAEGPRPPATSSECASPPYDPPTTHIVGGAPLRGASHTLSPTAVTGNRGKVRLVLARRVM